MKYFTLAMVAGAGALLASSAFAAPLNMGSSGVTAGSDIEQVRTVCDEYGRCYRSRGARRVIIQDNSYGYAPRRRYYDRRYDDGARVGVGVPGVGVSIGVGRDRW